jgi:hypothetical protein
MMPPTKRFGNPFNLVRGETFIRKAICAIEEVSSE